MRSSATVSRRQVLLSCAVNSQSNSWIKKEIIKKEETPVNDDPADFINSWRMKYENSSCQQQTPIRALRKRRLDEFVLSGRTASRFASLASEPELSIDDLPSPKQLFKRKRGENVRVVQKDSVFYQHQKYLQAKLEQLNSQMRNRPSTDDRPKVGDDSHHSLHTNDRIHLKVKCEFDFNQSCSWNKTTETVPKTEEYTYWNLSEDFLSSNKFPVEMSFDCAEQ